MKWLILLLLAFSLQAEARIHRSAAAVAHFKLLHPCPANGRIRGPCPGWVVDHVNPLCNGGPDDPANMQWQTRAESIKKDRLERAICRVNR